MPTEQERWSREATPFSSGNVLPGKGRSGTFGALADAISFGRSSNTGGLWVLESHDATGAVVDLVRLPFGGTGNWIGVATTYKPAANIVSVVIYADNTASGTFLFDDASLIKN